MLKPLKHFNASTLLSTEISTEYYGVQHVAAVLLYQV